MTIRQPTRVVPQPPTTPPRQRRQWDMLLIGIAFGFVCGVLLTVGLVWLLSPNSASGQPSPTGNGGSSLTASPTATSTPRPTFTPTFTPTLTPSPTATPLPSPTPVPTASNSGGSLLGPDDPRFYLGLFILFIIAVAIFLARNSSPPAKK